MGSNGLTTEKKNSSGLSAAEGPSATLPQTRSVLMALSRMRFKKPYNKKITKQMPTPAPKHVLGHNKSIQ